VTKAADAGVFPRPLPVSGSRGSDGLSFFFVVGCPRSGTTLLRWMLDAHPSIAVTPETHFGERYVSDRDPAPEHSRLDDFCASLAFEQMSIDEGAFRDRVSAEPTGDVWRPLRIAMEDFARARKASIVGEKTPSHSLHLDALAAAFPAARFVMIRRDPRAVAASWHRASWSHHTPGQIAETWCRYSRALHHAAHKMSSRCLEIAYEDLVQDPSRVLGTVCEFLGTDFDPQMLRYPAREDDSMSPEERTDHALTFEDPKPARIAAWRGELSDRDLRRIEAICAGLMRRSGYSPTTSIWERAPDMLRWLPSSWRKRIKHRLRRRA